MNKYRSRYLLLPMLFFLISTNIACGIVNAVPQDYSSIGINNNERYGWTLSEVNGSALESLTGSFNIYARDGKTIYYNIESIIANSEGYDVDNWTIEYEFWNIANEPDDDGFDTAYIIYKDPNVYYSILNNWISGSDTNPSSFSLQLMFIPVPVENFLKESASYGAAYSSSGKEISYDAGSLNVSLIYTENGILESVEVIYQGFICYILTLTEAPNLFWLLFTILGITGASICVLVIVLRRKGRKV